VTENFAGERLFIWSMVEVIGLLWMLTADEFDDESGIEAAFAPKKVVALSSKCLSSGMGGFGPKNEVCHLLFKT
jgi:hypothetical protein